MNNKYPFLYQDEITVLNLRKLYEKCGFRKYRMEKFESYDFYAKNRDFLVGNRIISFSDLNGKLMALKPDVTLSIVKNADKLSEGRQKLYYTENVYRESKDIHEFKEIFQVGLEVLGDIDVFETAEIISLAVKSLIEIHPDALLEISHMGYTEGLLDCMSQDPALRSQILELLSGKNAHDFKRLAEKHSFPKTPVITATGLLGAAESNDKAIEYAEANALNAKMQDAINEVKTIYELMKKWGLGEHIRIDLSVADDSGYYNGILMHGYVAGIPRDVLSGGRYDMLMSKMGKTGSHAMGFAIYFDALDRQLHAKGEDEINAYVICDEGSDPDLLTELLDELHKSDLNYTMLSSLPWGAGNARVYTVTDKDVEEAII